MRSHTEVSIKFQTAVLRDGKVVRRSPWRRNLILDQGLDRVAVEQWCDVFKVAAVGTGALVIKRKDIALTFSRAGNEVTASGSFFDAGDVGRLFKFDSGEEMYVTAYTDATHVDVSETGTIAAGPGSLWFVNSTGLVAESKRSQTYSASLGANSTNVTDNVLLHKRTFIFSAEVGTVTYTEVGWSWTTTPGGNLFGMAPLGLATQTLDPGDQFQVVVQMSVVIVPDEPTAVADTSGGAFNTLGTQMIESLGVALSSINTNGTTSTGNALEPSVAPLLRAVLANWTQETEIVTSPVPWGVSTVAVGMALQAYVAGTFERSCVGSLGITIANGSVYGFGFDSGQRTMSIKFTTPQTKPATHRIDVVYKRTWQRALNNAVDDPL